METEVLKKLETNLRNIQTLALLLKGQDTEEEIPGGVIRGCARILLEESEQALELIDAPGNP